MYFDISTIIPAISFVLYVTFTVFGFLQYRKDRFYWSFQLYMVMMAIWSFGSMMMHLNSPVMTPLFWNRIMLIGLLSVPYPLTSFIVDILDIKHKWVRWAINLSYLLIIPLMLLNFSGSIVSAAGFTAEGEFYYHLADGAMSAYSISYIYLIITLVLLLFGATSKRELEARRNLTLPLVGVLVMLVGIFINIFPTLGKYPIDIFAASINAVLLFYSIYKFKLINYSKAGIAFLYSTILFAISSLIYLIILIVLETFSVRFTFGNITLIAFILGSVTLIIIHPLRGLLNHLIDTVIVPRRHPYQETVRSLSRRLTTIVHLQELAEEVVRSLADSTKSEWALFIARKSDEDPAFYLLAQQRCTVCEPNGSVVSFSFPSTVQTRLPAVICASVDEESFPISETLPAVDIIVPLVCRGETFGYILMGYDHTKTMISKIEEEALEILATHCSLSLENALAFERLRIQGNELAITNDKLEAIFNGIGSPVCMIDIGYTIQEANLAALHFMGKERKQVIGTKCYASLFGRSRPCVHCLGLDCIHTGVVQDVEAQMEDKYLSFEFHSLAAEQVFIEIISDITEHRKLREELVRAEKMAGVGTLASGIAHELNNPLAGIVGTAEIMLDDAKEDVSKEYLTDILTYAQNASNVIKELAIYSHKGEEETKEPVEVIPILEFALRLALRSGDYRQIAIERNYHALPTIEANETDLQQLFLNLIVNAFQAMEHTGILTLTCIEEVGFVRVKIADTGKGIPADQINQIFTPFYTTKDPGEGTGLGLSNCYTIVERLDGRIRVESEAGKGSEFTVLFVGDETQRELIHFSLATRPSDLDDVFFIQRKVLVGEKGYLNETIHRSEDEQAIHILAYKGLQPVGTVSLMTSEHFWPLPIAADFDIEPILKTTNCAEIVRLAVLPHMRNTSASIGLIILVFLLARAMGVEELVIDIFSDDTKTIRLYEKFGFVRVGTYRSPSEVTVMALLDKSTLETNQEQLRHFVRPLFRRLRPLFDFEQYNDAVHAEMDRILSAAEPDPKKSVAKEN